MAFSERKNSPNMVNKHQLQFYCCFYYSKFVVNTMDPSIKTYATLIERHKTKRCKIKDNKKSLYCLK